MAWMDPAAIRLPLWLPARMIAATAVALAIGLAAPGITLAQGAAAGYPDKPIRVIAPVPAGGSPEDLDRHLRGEARRWAEVIKAQNIRAE